MKKTLTKDNNTENAMHKAITTKGVKCYPADPYASWQRGGNEQIKGPVGKYLPKDTDFSRISDKEVAYIQWAINNRPRKCLGFKTPIESTSRFVVFRG